MVESEFWVNSFSRYVFLGDVSLEFSAFLLQKEFNQKVINFSNGMKQY